MIYPTKSPAGRKSKTPAKRSSTKSGAREIPDIRIHVKGNNYPYSHYIKAHLANKHGYLYLCWRDGDKKKEFYLGKSPKSYTTATSSPAPASGTVPARKRGVKK